MTHSQLYLITDTVYTTTKARRTGKIQVKFMTPKNYSLAAYLNDIQTHIDNVFRTSTVVTCPRVALQCIAQITTVQVVISQVVVTSPTNQRSLQVTLTTGTSLLVTMTSSTKYGNSAISYEQKARDSAGTRNVSKSMVKLLVIMQNVYHLTPIT